jgi:hypothetical protein
MWMTISAKSMLEVKRLKSMLGDEFKIKDLGVAKKIQGMEIHRERKAGNVKTKKINRTFNN